MRRNTFAPPMRPAVNSTRPRTVTPQPAPARKIFNCIVDETALIAGVKRSTRDGIRKWVSQGAIRLYVPLHTLTQLDRLKKGADRTNGDAREAIKWLDQVTSQMPGDSAGEVHLEGVDEVFVTWEEVEQFLLPETLLSMEDSASESDDDAYSEDLESSFNQLELSDETSMSSSHSLDQPPKSPNSATSALSATDLSAAQNDPHAAVIVPTTPDRATRTSAESTRRLAKSPKSTVPSPLRPLFNHILWRIHKETNPDAALASFILLTNDPAKQVIAQKFGVRAKRLEQLRDAVARESREYKNHMMVHKLESEHTESQPSAAKGALEPTSPTRPKSNHSANPPESEDEDEDEVLFKRVPRGPQAQKPNGQRVFDPNDFGRANQTPALRGGRGGLGAPANHRGRGMSPRGRGASTPRGGSYVAPGPSFKASPSPRDDLNQPIDPDSFTRPTPRTQMTRGGRRRLWEPN